MTQETRQTSIIRDQNEDRNSDFCDSDNESEDELHYVLISHAAHGIETLNPEAETF